MLFTPVRRNYGYDLFDDFFNDSFLDSQVAGRSTTNLMRTDIKDDGTNYHLEMELPGFKKEDLWTCYPEFVEYEPYCRFKGCSHINEPDCGVKEALSDGKISQVRYDNYKLLYEELKNRQRY